MALHIDTLEVITVQSAGLRQLDDGTYASTLFSDRDDFGMLGGFVRALAAQELYWRSPNTPFVFCNGKSAKQIAKFGPDVPTDAEIYAQEFKQGIAADERQHTLGRTFPKPRYSLENTSVNTVASIGSLIAMCQGAKLTEMGLVSSDYHIPRIRGLCELIFQKLGIRPVNIIFLSAEAVLKELRPGVYDKMIDDAYITPSAIERTQNEQKGCDDIAAGRYHIGEFQLVTKK